MTIEVKYYGIDSWNRPIFKDAENNYYGSTDKLFAHTDLPAKVLSDVDEDDLTYFGNHFGCEPMGTKVEGLKIQDKFNKETLVNMLEGIIDYLSSVTEKERLKGMGLPKGELMVLEQIYEHLTKEDK